MSKCQKFYPILWGQNCPFLSHRETNSLLKTFLSRNFLKMNVRKKISWKQNTLWFTTKLLISGAKNGVKKILQFHQRRRKPHKSGVALELKRLHSVKNLRIFLLLLSCGKWENHFLLSLFSVKITWNQRTVEKREIHCHSNDRLVAFTKSLSITCVLHISREITDISSHSFLAKISWN